MGEKKHWSCSGWIRITCVLVTVAACAARARPDASPFEVAHACPSEDACVAACESGDVAGACVVAGRYAERAGRMNFGVWYERACRLDSEEGCARKEALQPVGKALPIFSVENACQRGAAEPCLRLARAYDLGELVPKNPKTRDEVYRRAGARFLAGCGNGSSIDCSGLAALYAAGRGVPKDDARAAVLYERGCDLGDPVACARLGAGHTKAPPARVEPGRELALDPSYAIALYQKTCEQKQARGCVSLGYAYEVGVGVTRSLSKAVELYRGACEQGELEGCFAQARLYYLGGEGVAQDIARAGELFRRACLGSKGQLGCRELTLMFERGETKHQSGAEILKIHEDACKQRDRFACAKAAHMLAEGGGVPRDRARALTLYGVACNLSYGPGCFVAGQIALDTAVDRDAALRWFQRGCKVSDRESCEQLQQLTSPAPAPPAP